MDWMTEDRSVSSLLMVTDTGLPVALLTSRVAPESTLVKVLLGEETRTLPEDVLPLPRASRAFWGFTDSVNDKGSPIPEVSTTSAPAVPDWLLVKESR